MTVKYRDILTVCMYMNNGHEVYVFVNGKNRDRFFHWQKGAQTVNIKMTKDASGQGIDCFSLSYQSKPPSLRRLKTNIVDYINDNLPG